MNKHGPFVSAVNKKIFLLSDSLYSKHFSEEDRKIYTTVNWRFVLYISSSYMMYPSIEQTKLFLVPTSAPRLV